MSGSGRKALTDDGEWSVGPPGSPSVVERPSRISGSGRNTLPDVREWLVGPPGCPGVVEMPPRMSGSGREALPDIREWWGVVERISRMSESVRERSEGPPG